jgi:hypothetical protein
MTTGTLEATTPAPGEAIVARPGRYYRNMRYLFVTGMLVMAAWFGYDGWVRYPRERALHQQDRHAGAPHSDLDINFQRILACALPPAALLFLAWTLYNTRGTYRLSGDVLSVPGHPDVPLDAVRAIDKSRWDRKGIAYVEYDVNGQQGRLRLDDFLYERGPTDKIVEQIEARLVPESAEAESVHESHVE